MLTNHCRWRAHRSIGPLLGLLAMSLLCRTASAAPEAHLLRVDPRASLESGDPVVTTVIEVVQSKRVSEATAGCAAARGDAQLDCIATALEAPGALYQAFPFPADNALFTVNVDGSDVPAKFVSQSSWGDSLTQPRVGTAWLLLVDADSRMGSGFEVAKLAAERFVTSMGPHDIVNVMLFNDRQVVQDSKWVNAAQRSAALTTLGSVTSTYSSQGRSRPLLSIIQTAATDAFKALGNVGGQFEIPLHQAMVVLSSGYGGADPKTSGPGALQLRQYMTGGRFPEDNTALPKTPVPVISVYFPRKTYDEIQQNSLEFMRDMANPEIGGYFTVLRPEQTAKADSLVRTVRTRFSKMHLVKWRLSCIAPTITQSFSLVFREVQPPIAGDATFKDVPIGIDPTSWPLDVDVKYTREHIGKGVYPAGRFKVYGNFCWGGEKSRAEVYFLPAGQAPPTELSGSDIGQAKEAQKRLIATGMRGTALEVADGFVEFLAPDNEKIVHGSGSAAVVRAVVYDNKARRTSGVTAANILELKATSAPFPLAIALGGAFGLGLLTLGFVALMRRGGNQRGSAATRTPLAQNLPRPAFASTAVPHKAVYDDARVTPHSAVIHHAVLEGMPGVFTLSAGQEIKAGRNGELCTVLVSDPQVSGVHASLKLEERRLLLRDENSNNGTSVDGSKVQAGQWVAVADGSRIRLGPIELRVTFK